MDACRCGTTFVSFAIPCRGSTQLTLLLPIQKRCRLGPAITWPCLSSRYHHHTCVASTRSYQDGSQCDPIAQRRCTLAELGPLPLDFVDRPLPLLREITAAPVTTCSTASIPSHPLDSCPVPLYSLHPFRIIARHTVPRTRFQGTHPHSYTTAATCSHLYVVAQNASTAEQHGSQFNHTLPNHHQYPWSSQHSLQFGFLLRIQHEPIFAALTTTQRA